MILVTEYFGTDKYSFYIILLSTWVVGLMFISLIRELRVDSLSNKIFVFNVVLSVLVRFFRTNNLLLIYLFFEIRLIPTFIVVLYWGNNWERLEASFYLLMYMMFISLPLLFYIIILSIKNYNLDFNLIIYYNSEISCIFGRWDFLILFGAFFIKLPIYLFHVWLPKAHVEAPVYGSILLAAILLKLGEYGLIRLRRIFIYSCIEYSDFIVRLGFVGALYVSLYCLVQVDIKIIVAYSSVVHINFIIASLFSLLKVGVIRAVVVMISHGLCSSGLFYIVNIFYTRSNSRLIIINKGYINIIPTIIMWWFFLCVSNFSYPFSLNFLGEIIIIIVFLGWCSVLIVIVRIICFFRGAYSLYLFSIVSHGEYFSMSNSRVNEGILIEHLSLLIHYIPLIMLLVNFWGGVW